MTRSPRYSAVAIALHWAIAGAIIFMIWLGWNMDDNEDLFQLHKSIGITILLLTVARIAWRMMNPPPPLPDMAGWEKTLSELVHLLFYLLLVLMPLSGWLLVSTSYKFDIPTVLYGVVSWPDLPGVDFLKNEDGHEAIEFVHSKLAWVIIGLLALHVLGALKHEFSSEEGVLKRMLPGLFGRTDRPTTPPRGFIVAFGLALVVFGLVAGAPYIAEQAGKLQSSNDSGGTEDDVAGIPQLPDEQRVGDAAEPYVEQAPTAIPPAPQMIRNWEVDYDQSFIAFGGTHDGSRYEGEFLSWGADIQFMPDNLENSVVRVTVTTASGETTKKLYTDTLKGAEWFNPSEYRHAVVDLTNFRQTGEDAYVADAAVYVKDRSMTVPFSFELDIDDDEARLKGETTLQRAPLNLGQESDPNGDWVGEDVAVRVELLAYPRN